MTTQNQEAPIVSVEPLKYTRKTLVQNEEPKEIFTFNQLKPNLSTFKDRAIHFSITTSPFVFFTSNAKILADYQYIQDYRQLEETGEPIYVTHTERQKIQKALNLTSGSVKEGGELVPRLFRMNGFLFTNIPILCGMVFAPPTMFNTMFFQWINQSYMAGLNYANKNPSCTFTNEDLAIGYGAAVSSSIIVAVALRKMTAGMTKGSTGAKLLLLNTFVNGVASGAASFFNTSCMRRAEVQKGINVYSSESLSPDSEIGISKICAQQAVTETALSRVMLSVSVVSMPAMAMLSLGKIGPINRVLSKSPKAKTMFDMTLVVGSISLGLPLAIGIFPPVSQNKGYNCEEKFKNHENVYFSKGL